MNPIKWKFHWQILFSIVLAALIASILRVLNIEDSSIAHIITDTCDFLGSLFMRALKMIIVPLIATSMLCGMLSIGGEKSFGRVGRKVILYYAFTGLFAILVGLLLVNIIQPGHVSEHTAELIVGQARMDGSLTEKFDGRSFSDIINFFNRMVPTNIMNAASDNGQLLGLIVFCLLFGYFINKLPIKMRSFQVDLWESLQGVMMGLTQFIIKFAPIGVFGLILPVILRTGWDIIVPLMLFFITVLLALLIHMFGTLSIMLYKMGGINPLRHLKTMLPVLITAFSSASSSATLPLTIETVEKESGVSNRISSFTLPLGATVNMDGTALYECVVVIFIAQFYGVLEGFDITLITQFKVVMLALLTSVGVAGIPAASLVAISLILGFVGLPLEAIGLVWVTDRILDMCRTAVNVYSDTCAAVIIGKLEGEENIYTS